MKNFIAAPGTVCFVQVSGTCVCRSLSMNYVLGATKRLQQ